MPGFVSGFADGLSAGLDRNERARARKKNQNQPDYTDIDNKYGTGVGAWIGRQKSGISDWLHRNTGGVLGHSSDPMSGGGQPWDEKMDLGSGVGAVDLGGGGSYVQSEARGGRVRGYADGGGVVRSFRDGGVSDAPFSLYDDRGSDDPLGVRRADYEGVPRIGPLTREEIDANTTAEINRRLGPVPREASPAPSGQWEQEGLTERGRQGIAARRRRETDYEGSIPKPGADLPAPSYPGPAPAPRDPLADAVPKPAPDALWSPQGDIVRANTNDEVRRRRAASYEGSIPKPGEDLPAPSNLSPGSRASAEPDPLAFDPSTGAPLSCEARWMRCEGSP
jgi:hypothetical protein